MSTDMAAHLAARLDPSRMRVSPQFTAVLAYVLGEEWTEPAIVDMAITSDGFLMVGTTADPLLDEMIGTGDDLWRNLRGVAAAAELEPAATRALLAMARARVTDWQNRPAFEEVSA